MWKCLEASALSFHTALTHVSNELFALFPPWWASMSCKTSIEYGLLNKLWQGPSWAIDPGRPSIAGIFMADPIALCLHYARRGPYITEPRSINATDIKKVLRFTYMSTAELHHSGSILSVHLQGGGRVVDCRESYMLRAVWATNL